MLIDYSYLKTIRNITSNNLARYNQCIYEAENYDLKELLGIKLLQSLQNVESEWNDKLLDGDTFELEGDNVTHKGLRFVLAYLTFTRYYIDADVADTDRKSVV